MTSHTSPFLPGVPEDRVRAALAAAGGNEIESGKLDSPESSAALAVNAFGWFNGRPADLPLFPPLADLDWPAHRVDVERQMRFPWRGGRHPWLDAAVETTTNLIGTTEPQDFWQQVDANFSAGRIKMVFVADTIPRELARIVEFLNEQMKADVRAVELSWFESEGGVTALTPRIIGETERAQTEKAARSALPPIAREAWIETKLGPCGKDVVNAADAFVAMIDELGGRAEVTSSQGSILSVFDTFSGPLYPFRLSNERKGSVQLYLGHLIYRPAFADEAVRQRLYDDLVAIVGPLSTRTLNGFPGFDARKLNDPAIVSALAGYLRQLLGDVG